MRSRRFSIGLLAISLLLGFVCFGLFAWQWPEVAILKTTYPQVAYQGPNEPPKVTLMQKPPKNWVRLGDISKVAVGAVLVSEDWAFYQHKGIDPRQIEDALRDSWEEGRFVRGASTITQQVTRNVFLSREKTLWRKFREIILAIYMEKRVGKRKILETYLNIAEWGVGVFGISQAAQHYFSKTPAELTAREGAFLAMLLPSPKRYSQSFRRRELSDFARETVDSILQKMVRAGYLAEEELEGARVQPMQFEAVLELDQSSEPVPSSDNTVIRTDP